MILDEIYLTHSKQSTKFTDSEQSLHEVYLTQSKESTRFIWLTASSPLDVSDSQKAVY